MTASPVIRAAEAAHVCKNMRAKSFEEIDALGLDRRTVAERVFGHAISWTFFHEGRPVALLGAYPIHRGVWTLFGLGTEEWESVWREVTLVARRDMMAAVSASGAHRAHCLALSTHDDTHKWLRVLGATHEAQLPGYGANGEDFIMFSWLKR